MRAGVLAAIAGTVIVAFVIWLFGYMTGYRMATPFLVAVSACLGLAAGTLAFLDRDTPVT